MRGESSGHIVESPAKRLQRMSFGDLHAKVIAGDKEALVCVVERILPMLIQMLRNTFPHSPDDWIEDATVDAILDYASHPTRFDPSRSVPLVHFLRCAARRNLQDLWRSDYRRRAREREYVAEHERLRRPEESKLEVALDMASLKRQILEAIDDGAERDACIQWLNGVSAFKSIAAILDLTHLPDDEQRIQVKRFKDRIRKRIGRMIR